MSKRKHFTVLLAGATLMLPLSMPAQAMLVNEPTSTPAVASVSTVSAYDHEADRLPTRQRGSKRIAVSDQPQTAGEPATTRAAAVVYTQEKLQAAWSTVTGESLKDTVTPGTHAATWLTLQRTGAAASANPQAASAVQREKAADRFLKTYDFPIKESFYGDGFKSGSN